MFFYGINCKRRTGRSKSTPGNKKNGDEGLIKSDDIYYNFFNHLFLIIDP